MNEGFDPRRFGKTARNEQRRLLATTLNTIGLATFGVGVLTPFFNQGWRPENLLTAMTVCVILVVLHMVAQRILRDLEE